MRHCKVCWHGIECRHVLTCTRVRSCIMALQLQLQALSLRRSHSPLLQARLCTGHQQVAHCPMTYPWHGIRGTLCWHGQRRWRWTTGGICYGTAGRSVCLRQYNLLMRFCKLCKLHCQRGVFSESDTPHTRERCHVCTHGKPRSQCEQSVCASTQITVVNREKRAVQRGTLLSPHRSRPHVRACPSFICHCCGLVRLSVDHCAGAVLQMYTCVHVC